MTEQSSRPTAEAADQSQPHDQALDLAGSATPAQDVVASAEADVTAEAPVDAVADESNADSEQKVEKSAKKRVPPQEVVARLVAAWPLAFFSDPRSVKPLAIGVLQQILAARPAELEGLNSHAIRTGIKFYTSRLSYHYGMVHNTHRITLAGESAEEVDDKAREFAKAQILAIKQQREARHAAQNPPGDTVGEAGGDESAEGKKPPRAKQGRKPRPAPRGEGKARGESTDGSPSAQRPRRPRRDQLRPPRAEKRAATEAPAASSTENLSMEEKLARLAQHFGKSS